MARPAARRKAASPTVLLDPRLFRLTIGAGLALIVLVLLHTTYVNGPSYWHWGWQRLGFWRAYPGVLAAAAPFLLAQYLHERKPSTWILGLGLLMVTAAMLEWNTIVMMADARASDRLWQLVEDTRVTGYYTDALRSQQTIPSIKEWLVAFPDLLSRFNQHGQNKPPGLILYYLFFVRTFSVVTHQAAIAAGLVIGALATAAIPAVFFLVRAFGSTRQAAFLAASAMTLCPGLIVFFPEFDQLYAAATALIIGCWVLALRRQSRWWALGCGLVLTLACFVTFSLLVLGLFMAGAAWYLWWKKGECTLRQVFEYGAIVLGTVAVCYSALWVTLGFNMAATFTVSFENQTSLETSFIRPYPQTIVSDLWDYSLGLGWMSALLFIGALSARDHADAPGQRGFAWLTLGLLGVLAVFAILPGETARVWIFLFPLALPAVGRELRRWSFNQGLGFFAVSFASLAVIGQNMGFFSLTPGT